MYKSSINRIDAHQHFWHYDSVKDGWITPEMQVIRRDFLPADLEPLLAQNKVMGCVAVQASQADAETHFLLDLASKHDFIEAVVGWIDFKASAPDLFTQLEQYQSHSKLKGFRHVLQGEDLDSFLADGCFSAGLSQLKDFGYTYDLLAFDHQLPAITKLVQQHPAQPFVLDHLGKPDLKTGRLDAWKEHLTALAAEPNVVCKLSGLVTEGDWQHWSKEQVTACLDIVVEAFGPTRLMFGSDWPVCLLATSYQRWLDLLGEYFSTFSSQEQGAIFGGNARSFYKITAAL